MLSHTALAVSTSTLHRLLDHLRREGKGVTPEEAVEAAIALWLEREREEPGGETIAGGYQWKSLFLPDGTKLTVIGKYSGGYARVIGDKLIFQGLPTSPNQFVLAVGGYVRNAWSDVIVHLPDGSRPKLAAVLRRESQSQATCGPEPAKAEPPVSAAKPSIAIESATEWPYIDRRSLTVYAGDVPFG